MSSWILISKRAGDLLMTAVLLVRFHVRGTSVCGPKASRRIVGRILTNMAEVNKGLSGDTKCRSNCALQGNWYAIRLVLGRNWINDDNLKATYKRRANNGSTAFSISDVDVLREGEGGSRHEESTL